MTPMEIKDTVTSLAEELGCNVDWMTDLDDGLVGYAFLDESNLVPVYDYNKCIESIIAAMDDADYPPVDGYTTDELKRSEAVTHFDFNVAGTMVANCAFHPIILNYPDPSINMKAKIVNLLKEEEEENGKEN